MARARRLLWISVLAGVVYLVWRWRAQQAGDPGYLPGPAAPNMPGPAPRAPIPEQPPEPAAPPAAEAEAVTLRERAVGAAAPAEPEAPAAEEPAVEGVDLAPLVGPGAAEEPAEEPAGDEVEGVDLAPLVGPGAEAGGVDLASLVGPAAALGATGLEGPVNINTAELEALIALPGIGPALARRIVAYRNERGPFTSIEQLIDIQGIGPRNIDEFRHLITV